MNLFLYFFQFNLATRTNYQPRSTVSV